MQTHIDINLTGKEAIAYGEGKDIGIEFVRDDRGVPQKARIYVDGTFSCVVYL